MDEFRVSISQEAQGRKRPRPLRVFINIEDMKTLNFHAGDFLEVGEMKGFGIAWPSMAILSSSKLEAHCRYSSLRNIGFTM